MHLKNNKPIQLTKHWFFEYFSQNELVSSKDTLKFYKFHDEIHPLEGRYTLHSVISMLFIHFIYYHQV